MRPNSAIAHENARYDQGKPQGKRVLHIRDISWFEIESRGALDLCSL